MSKIQQPQAQIRINFFVLFILTVFGAELGLMLLLPHIIPEHTPEVFANFLDAALLSLIVSVALWFGAVRYMRESEVRFQQLTGNIDEMFWISDPQFAKMSYVSPAYEQIWGATVQSLYNSPMSFTDAIHPEDRKRILSKLPDQAQGGYDEEYRIVRLDGSVHWVRARAFPIATQKYLKF